MRTNRLSSVKPSAAAVLLTALVALVAYARPAFAYVDPSVVTYTIQALAAVAVALSAVAGVAFRRSRGVIFKLLGIDEDAGKVVEPAVSRINPAYKNAADAAAKESFAEAAKPQPEKRLSWGGRFWRALLAAETLTLTLFVVAPLELVAGNQQWLLFGLGEVTLPVIVAGVVSGLALAIPLSLLKGKAFGIALCLTVGLAVCCYMQALLFNGPLPVVDGATVNWDDYTKITLASAAFWLLILVAFVILAVRIPRIGRFACMAVCVVLILIQAVGIASLVLSSSKDESPITVTQKGLFDVSSENNVVVFVLDACDTRLFEGAVEEDPSIQEALSGFTYYRNAVGAMEPTWLAIPSILNAQHPTSDDETAEDYFSRRYQGGAFLDDLVATGCDIGIYSENAAYDDNEYQVLEAHADNVRRVNETGASFFDPVGAVRILWKAALYRDMPWVLKPYFWYVGDEVNDEMFDVRQTDRAALENTPYIIDDVDYYHSMLENPLVLNDSKTGSFRFIHLMGSHYPYDMTRDVRRIGAYESNALEQTIGAFKIVAAYLEQLKALGVYEETTVIVTADHGKLYTNLVALSEPTNAVMLVKPQGQSAEEAAASLRVSEAPVSHRDFHPTVLDQFGADTEVVASYDGEPVYDVEENADRTRYYYMNNFDEKGYGRYLLEYEIDGDAHDFSSWSETGNIWYFEKGLRELGSTSSGI